MPIFYPPSPGGSGVSDHGQLTGLGDDDHAQYQLRTEKGQANGYVPLDENGLIDSDLIPGYGAAIDGGSFA